MTAEATKLLSELDRLKKENAKITESRDELLETAHSFIIHLARSDKMALLKIIEEKVAKANALKKEMFEESLPFK